VKKKKNRSPTNDRTSSVLSGSSREGKRASQRGSALMMGNSFTRKYMGDNISPKSSTMKKQ